MTKPRRKRQSGFSILAAVAFLAIAGVAFVSVSKSFTQSQRLRSGPHEELKRTIKMQDVSVVLSNDALCMKALSGTNALALKPQGGDLSYSIPLQQISLADVSIVKPGDRIDGLKVGSLVLSGKLAGAPDAGAGTVTSTATLPLTSGLSLKINLTVDKASHIATQCTYRSSSADDMTAKLEALCKQLNGAYVPRSPANLTDKYCRLSVRRFGGTMELGEAMSGCETKNQATHACKCPDGYSPVPAWRMQEELKTNAFDDVVLCWR